LPGVPEIRISKLNSAPLQPEGDFVLYWMIAFRRTRWNFALDRAIEWARKLGKPLLILEALRCDYRWACERFHRFVLDGMAEKLRRLSANAGVRYYPYVEPAPGQSRGLLGALAARSCLVVTDDYPCFFLPRMVHLAARAIPVRLESVDSNGLLPLRAADRSFVTAYSFRRFLQRKLPAHLFHFPQRNPLARLALPSLKSIPRDIERKWPPSSLAMLENADSVSHLPIDHAIGPAPIQGGELAGQHALRRFLSEKLGGYSDSRNHPDSDSASGLSPYLHFGHISAHQTFYELTQQEKWSPAKLALGSNGSRSGWWGLSQPAEEFLDQLVTWRELGFNSCTRCSEYDRYDSLPGWARETLERHVRDKREHCYSLADFAAARTMDPLWNAAQRQLISEGRIHNYLRMLWGKKILEWSPSPRRALQVMIELNNRFALDGRDPNSYSGIFWCLGRYDHPWGPERPVFGTVRYMSSRNTARKFHLKEYLARYAG